MQTSIYNSMFGALTQEERLDIIANNLANISTTGFKKEKLSFKDDFARLMPGLVDPVPSIRSKMAWPKADLLSQPVVGESRVDFTDGGLRQTGNPLDLAIQGDGFFKVGGDEGVFFTRSGHFLVNDEGLVVTPQGLALLSDGGPLEVPAGTKELLIGQNGQVMADGRSIGNLEVVSVTDLSALEKQGSNLFRAKRGIELEEGPITGEVAQGYLENSNVEVVVEMVNMVETMRAFEAYQKIMTRTAQADEKLIRDVGTPR